MSGSLFIIFAKGSCNVCFYIFATMGLYEMIYPSRLMVGPRGYVLIGDENKKCVGLNFLSVILFAHLLIFEFLEII